MKPVIRIAIVLFTLLLLSSPYLASAEDEVLFNKTFVQELESGGREFTPTMEDAKIRVEIEVLSGESLDFVISNKTTGEWSASDWELEDYNWRAYDTSYENTTVQLDSMSEYTIWIYEANYRNPEIKIKITQLNPDASEGGLLPLPILPILLSLPVIAAFRSNKNNF